MKQYVLEIKAPKGLEWQWASMCCSKKDLEKEAEVLKRKGIDTRIVEYKRKKK